MGESGDALKCVSFRTRFGVSRVLFLPFVVLSLFPTDRFDLSLGRPFTAGVGRRPSASGLRDK